LIKKKIVQQWDLSKLKFFKNKKFKKVVLNFGTEVHEFEASKSNIKGLVKDIIDSQMVIYNILFYINIYFYFYNLELIRFELFVFIDFYK